MEPCLRKRLLQDVAELQQEPYPNIALHFDDADLSRACLVLTPNGWIPIHLTVELGPEYPLRAPVVRANTAIKHPNVFGSYICASILNTTEGYTPAYTLKGIAIQLLSFFGSDTIEQVTGLVEDLRSLRIYNRALEQTFACASCGFDSQVRGPSRRQQKRDRRDALAADAAVAQSPHAHVMPVIATPIATMPDEILLMILEGMGFAQLTAFSGAWGRISGLITRYDLVRRRELQCFCLKTGFDAAKLGVGVAVGHGRGSAIESEFDLLSRHAFQELSIRHSVHGIAFTDWLPLPISHRHWQSVRGDVVPVLQQLGRAADMRGGSPVDVLAAFMNDIVVRLNQVTTPRGHAPPSTLRHASEKAIESYFHLFHLLLCLATAQPALVADANARVAGFVAGRRSKVACPNLGRLLVFLLISDVAITERLRKDIVTEAITRNVVWLLDRKGAHMPELSYMEPDRVSAYRLRRTFEGSRTSYRLLMFSELFRRTARPSDGQPLEGIRDELFERHGGPAAGAAAKLAAEVRRLHDIDNFPHFFREMGIENTPDAERFTTVLRETVKASVRKGYSEWALSPGAAFTLRQRIEPGVGLCDGVQPAMPPGRPVSFFPKKARPARGRMR